MAELGSKQKLKKLAMVLGVVTVVLIISTVYLVHYYGESRPTEEQAGRTHEATIHSRTVYLTNNEYALAFAMHGLTVVAIGLFIGTALKARFAKS
jgi:hypothetical protein